MIDVYISRNLVLDAFNEACAECYESCEEFDGIMPDCEQCPVRSARKKVEAIPISSVGLRSEKEDVHDNPPDHNPYGCGKMY